jgi:hypothetical protein
MLQLSIASRENLVLLSIALIAEIPICIQDLRHRTLPAKSWLKVAVIVALITGVLALGNRLRMHEDMYNMIFSLVLTLGFAVFIWLMFVFKKVHGADVLYMWGCLIPLSLCVTPIWIMGTLALMLPLALAIGLLQRTPKSYPLVSGTVMGGFLSLLAVLLLTVR